MHMLLSWLVLSIAVWITAGILPGFSVNGFGGALRAAAIFGILNWLLGWFIFVVLGIAAGLIARGFQLRVPWRPPDRLTRAAGFAFVISTIASVVWPAPFLAQVVGETDLSTALVSIPLFLAGPLGGGGYAARAGLAYRSIILLGTYMTLPIILTLIIGTVGGVGALLDPRFDSVAGQLRGTIVLSWFLVAMRIAGWPLGAAFAQGFLTPDATPRAEHVP